MAEIQTDTIGPGAQEETEMVQIFCSYKASARVKRTSAVEPHHGAWCVEALCVMRNRPPRLYYYGLLFHPTALGPAVIPTCHSPIHPAGGAN